MLLYDTVDYSCLKKDTMKRWKSTKKVRKKLTRNTFLNFEYAVGIGLGAGVGLRVVDIQLVTGQHKIKVDITLKYDSRALWRLWEIDVNQMTR